MKSDSAARARTIESILLPSALAALALAAWHGAVVATGTRVFPSPLAVLRGTQELAARGLLFAYARDSLLRVGAGFTIAALLGLPLGLAMGASPRLARAIDPAVQVLRPISPLAWIPLAIVFFGVSNASTIFLIALASLFPIITAAVSAVRGVPPIYLRAAYNFGLSPAAVLRRVVLPAALPRLLVGLRLALGVAWMVVVAAEMIAVDSGLGYLILDARNAGKRYDLVVAGMLLIGLIGLGLDLGARRLERLRALRWGFSGR